MTDVGVGGTEKAEVSFSIDFSALLDKNFGISPMIAMWCRQVCSMRRYPQTCDRQWMFWQT